MGKPKESYGTGRLRLVLKLFAEALRHPLLILKNLKPRNIRALFKKLRMGDIRRAQELVGYSMAAAAPLKKRLTLIDAKKTRYDALTLPKYDNPAVSIIIPVYNEWAYTHACVQAIIEHSGDIPYEVIIADDASTDETKELEKYITGAVHIRNEENLRFLRNCNRAAQSAKGKYILFLNNDTQPQPNWLEPLIRLMAGDETVGLAGSKLVYPNGKLQEAGGIVWNDASAWNYGRFDDPSKPDYNYVKDVDYISGAAIMVRKSLWEELNGFDERFAPAYYEDADLAFSIRNKGYRVVYQPLSAVVHFEGISNGTDEASGLKQYQADNKAKFFEKWKDKLRGAHFPNGGDVFWARDRSRSKKTILFIDQHVPMYDKDAGSRNTYQYIELCVEMGFNVLFMGDNFFPYQPYTDELQQMGVMVLHGDGYRDNWERWLRQNGDYIDVIYLNRPNISEKYIDAIKAHSRAKVAYHAHDLISARLRAQYDIDKDEALLKEADDWENRERAMFEKADINLILSEKEKSVIESIAPDKPVTVIPIFFYEDSPPIRDFAQRRDLLFVGGFGHPPNADAVLWFAKEVMPQLPGARLVVVGSKPPREVLELNSETIEIKGYVSDEELDELYAACRIAVIPLRFGAGAKGKTVEAAYNLIPIVSTSFGIEGLPEAETIIPPRDDAESFAKELNRLLSSDEACMDTALMYRRWIDKWFSRKRAAALMREIAKPAEPRQIN